MFSGEIRLKVIDHKVGMSGAKNAIVIIEKGHPATYVALKSARTGTQYRLTGNPCLIGDAEVVGGLVDVDFLCNYYRAHEDFATNEKMQKICETKHGFTYGPIRFAIIKAVPFRGELIGRNYVDEPEKYDIEVGDTLIGFRE